MYKHDHLTCNLQELNQLVHIEMHLETECLLAGDHRLELGRAQGLLDYQANVKMQIEQYADHFSIII